MSITTVDNFDSQYFDLDDTTNGFSFNICNTKYYFKSTVKINNDVVVNLKQYIDSQNELFTLFADNSRNDDLIISVSSYIGRDNKQNYSVNTGNYIGHFKYKKNDINIKSRFPDIFLKRMLNFANDVFLDDVSVFDAKENNKNSLDYSKFIIYYMFIQKLEKAFLLGLPKAYKSINNHEMKVKGQIDINRFIKYDIPFKGKVSSTSREQKEIQEVIDVLYKAIIIIEKNNFSTKNISHIKTHLKQHRSNQFVSKETINKAIKSKSLQNPIFAPYKKVLEYAKYIIDASNLEEKKDASKETFGFLVNVAELFEIYLYKLLQNNFPDWNVIHEEELEVYKTNFYIRKMKPDIVMKNKYNNKVMVFDAKYKRMLFRDRYHGSDLDRNDFFQINTYMTYYDKQESLEVIAGGLLYPIEEEFDCRFNDEKCKENYDKLKVHSDDWFGNNKTKFIVDGIDLSKDTLTMEDILKSENNFIERIANL